MHIHLHDIMYFTLQIIFVFCVLAVQLSHNACPVQTTVFKLIPFRDYKVTCFQHKTTPKNSIKECAEECVAGNNCKSFGYKTGSCTQYNTRPHAHEDSTPESGFRIYWALIDMCPNGYLYKNESETCYKIYHESLKWTDARKKCENDNGFLFMANSQQKKDLLLQIVAEESTTLHVGAKYSRNWMWMDGLLVNESWRLPSIPPTGKYCVAASKDLQSLSPQKCSHGNNRKMFICEIPVKA